MFSKTNDFSSKQREKNKEANNKEALLRKLKQKSENNKHHNATTKKATSFQDDNTQLNKHYKQLYRKIKTENEKINKSFEAIKVELKQVKLREKTLRKDNKKLKNKLFQLQQSINEKEEEIKKGQETYKANIQKITSLGEELVQQKTKSNNEIAQLEFRLKASNKRNEDLQYILDNINELQQDVNNTYERKIQTLVDSYESQIKKYIEKNKELQHIVDSNQKRFLKLHERLNISKSTLKEYEELQPSAILEKLYDKMTLENVFEFNFVNELVRKHKILKHRYFKNKNDNDQFYPDTDVIYGYIQKEMDRVVFVSVENVVYQINFIFEGQLKSYGRPCAAFLNENNTVDIFWYYETETEMFLNLNLEKRKVNKAKNIRKKTEEHYEYLGDFKVLIITSLNGVRYRNHLRHHGLIAQWVDPFEKSPIHIKTLMKSHDIVLLCVENMPHNILNIIDEDTPKYQFIINHNENTIITRTRIALNQLGLSKEKKTIESDTRLN